MASYARPETTPLHAVSGIKMLKFDSKAVSIAKTLTCTLMCSLAVQACRATPEQVSQSGSTAHKVSSQAPEQEPASEQAQTTVSEPSSTGVAEPPGTEPAEPSGTVEPSGSGVAEPTVIHPTQTGVIYPEKPGRAKSKPIQDALPPQERTPAENQRLSQMQFQTDPRQQIEKFIKSLKLPKDRPILQRGHLYYLDNGALAKTYPHSVFYVLRFPQWPIALEPTPPLGNNNVFVITKEESNSGSPRKQMELITDLDRDSLARFLKQTLSARDEDNANTAVEASLALAQEIEQDGMYKFEIAPGSIKTAKTNGSLKTTGRVDVVPTGGNSGSIVVNLTFADNGALKDFAQASDLQAGMRPICQSTKLLDPDPIVRKMAEQDLLLMGSSAKEYLDWQRTQVSPELRSAIDKMWARIVKEGR